METGAPIVPVVISGTEKLMRKGSANIYPGMVRVQMLPPIYPAEFTTREELMRAVREELVEALPREMQPLEV